MGGVTAVADIRWIPASTAAKMLKVSRQRVYTLIKLGQITGCKLDGHTFVQMLSVEDRITRLEKVRAFDGSSR